MMMYFMMYLWVLIEDYANSSSFIDVVKSCFWGARKYSIPIQKFHAKSTKTVIRNKSEYIMLHSRMTRILYNISYFVLLILIFVYLISHISSNDYYNLQYLKSRDLFSGIKCDSQKVIFCMCEYHHKYANSIVNYSLFT